MADMTMTLILITIIAGTFLLDYFVFTFIVKMLIKRSGMLELARRYPATYQPAGAPQRLYFARLGGSSFRRSVSMTLTDEGLYLAIVGVFQWLGKTKPAAVPWSEIRVAGEKKVNRMDAVELAIGDPPAGSLTMLSKDFTAVEPFLKKEEAPGY